MDFVFVVDSTQDMINRLLSTKGNMIVVTRSERDDTLIGVVTVTDILAYLVDPKVGFFQVISCCFHFLVVGSPCVGDVGAARSISVLYLGKKTRVGDA